MRPGQAKCTFGTGRIPAGAYRRAGRAVAPGVDHDAGRDSRRVGPPQYALEGSVFVAGAAVQWFRDGLKAIGASPEINPLALESDPDNELVFVPALTGLGAPHWEPAARGAIFGLTRATGVADLARATLEGVAFQVADLIDAMTEDLGTPLSDIRVDGGMSRSDPFLQFQADLLGPADPPQPADRVDGAGAALLAGLGAGLWPSAGMRDRTASSRRTNVPAAPRPGLARPRPDALAKGRREHAPVCSRVSVSVGQCSTPSRRA